MFEEAYGYKRLIENHHLTQDEVAKRMSISQSAVANKLRLLKLSYEEQQMIVESDLTERHARALLKLDDKKKRMDVISYIANNALNVCETEQYIEKLISEQNMSDTDKNQVKNEQNSSQKAANEMILAIKRRVEALRRTGSAATVRVVENDDDIDVYVKISKS